MKNYLLVFIIYLIIKVIFIAAPANAKMNPCFYNDTDYGYGYNSEGLNKFGQKSIEQNLEMISKLKIKSSKFDTIVKNEAIEILDYDFWVIDLQGSELLALIGAKESLEKCKSILVEISKTEYYKNAVKWEELKKFLNENNFFQQWEPLEDHTDILFIKNN